MSYRYWREPIRQTPTVVDEEPVAFEPTAPYHEYEAHDLLSGHSDFGYFYPESRLQVLKRDGVIIEHRYLPLRDEDKRVFSLDQVSSVPGINAETLKENTQ